ncbi:NAD(P)H-binding protein [Micromonospora sp. DPT]|uniref:NAD(P)H-binding protein n=1 Tax=Micromonospora sp. DPT TaxID=3142975 RepID=UPI00320B32CF
MPTRNCGRCPNHHDRDLDWTIVRFTAPRNGPARGVKRCGFYGTDKIGYNVTRADIAAFTAAQLGSWLTELGKSAQRGCLAQQH